MSFGFDPRLILAQQQYTGPDPNETMRTLAQLATQRVHQQQAQATLADLLEKQGQERALSEVFRQNSGNFEAVAPALMQRGLGRQALDWMGGMSEMQSRQANRDNLLSQAIQRSREQLGSLLYGTKDQADYEKRLAAVPPQQRGFFPPTWDEAKPMVEAWAIPAEKRAQLEATATAADTERTFRAGENVKDRLNRTKNAAILAGQKKDEASADATTGLRKEVNADKRIAKYRQSTAELDGLRKLAQQKGGANDMALVFAFMKALDPESAVREAEYEAAAATGKPTDRMMGLVSKYWTGGPLSDAQKAQFVKAAEAAQSGHKAAHDAAVKTYRAAAKKRGLDMVEVGLEEPEGPYGPTVEQDDKTYTWNPSTGEYEK